MASVLPSATDCCTTCDCPEVTNIPGAPGTDGAPGTGATVVPELPGVNCTAGGVKITDGDGNVSYVCAGADGTDGTDGTGTPGADGTNGINAFTVTTANFTQPAEGATVNIEVAESAWVAGDQHLYVTGGGDYQVTAVPDGTHITIRNLENTGSALYPGNAAPGAVIGSGADVSPGGIQGPVGATGATGPTGPSGSGANYFKVNKDGTDQSQTNDGTGMQVTFAAAEFNNGGVFDLATDVWTAPATGYYQFTVHLSYNNTNNGTTGSYLLARLYKNGAPGVGTLVGESVCVTEGEDKCVEINTILSLTATDTIQVNSFAHLLGGMTYDIIGATTDTWFTGFRIA